MALCSSVSTLSSKPAPEIILKYFESMVSGKISKSPAPSCLENLMRRSNARRLNLARFSEIESGGSASQHWRKGIEDSSVVLSKS
ncbi:hypothetical protein Csa_008322 [Cucumis sativus]|nr:hypothetical protein Csa_008322 [Cucumis sativus]